MLHELEYVSLKVQYIDGTKIESASGRYTFVWKKSVEKNKAKLEANITSVLSEIDTQIKQDQSDLSREETPKPIDSSELKKKMDQLNSDIQEKSKATQKHLKKLKEDYLPRLEKYEEQLEILGDRNSYSKTDPDAVFMRMKDDHMKNGQLKPAYNAQISTENQFITQYSLHQTTADTVTLASHLDSFEAQYQRQSEEIVADAGYGSEQNYELMEGKGIVSYVKYNYFHMEQKRKQQTNPFLVQNLFYNAQEDFLVCPAGQKLTFRNHAERTSTNGYISQVSIYQAQRCEGCPMRGQCHKAEGNRTIEINHRLAYLKAQAKERLLSEKGLYHRSKRPVEVEAVFGQLKSNNKFNRFTMRGLEKVDIEFALMAIAHNLRKWVKMIKNTALNPSINNKTASKTVNTYKMPKISSVSKYAA